MSEIIEKIRKIREQRKELEALELELVNTAVGQIFDIEKIYTEFLKLKGIDIFENLEQKKLFVFVCLSINCPLFIIGERTRDGVRRDIAKFTGLTSSRISNITSEVRFLYSNYKGFKHDADYLYTSIKSTLRQRC
jgi:hypothetical protein